MHAVSALPPDPVIVEVGSFLGKSTVMIAGALKRRGGGRVHCVDPFDGSGEAHSEPVYRAIVAQSPLPLLERFQQNLRRAGVSELVTVHRGTAAAIGATWQAPIDLLFLDGDQSPAGARAAYDAFAPFLKPGGILALHNSADRQYDEGHDGHRRLAQNLTSWNFTKISCIGSTTFATK